MTTIRTYSARELVPRELPFVWRHRFPVGAISVIAGRPGASKSLLSAFIAAELSNLGLVTVISNPEDDPHAVTRPRLDAHRARLDLCYVVSDEDFFELPGDLHHLEAAVRETSASLVVLDPIATHFPRLHARRELHRLGQVAKRTRCSILAIHHMTKTGQGLDAVAGATGGLSGTARAVYEFAPLDGADSDTIALTALKVNGAPRPHRIVFHRTQRIRRGVVSPVLVASGRHFDYGMPGEIADAAEWLTLFLISGEGCRRLLAEVKMEAERVGIRGEVLAGLADDMGFVIASRQGLTWMEPPEDHPLREECG